ncbi:MAG: response regulator [Pseudomonadota bacterium]
MAHRILLLEDEPLILMDLECAAQDCGCTTLIAATASEALSLIAANADDLTVAVLDVSLGGRRTCYAVAQELDRLEIPFILHSGDLDRHDERIRELDAELIAKPAPADKVITAAIAYALGDDPGRERLAAQ